MTRSAALRVSLLVSLVALAGAAAAVGYGLDVWENIR